MLGIIQRAYVPGDTVITSDSKSVSSTYATTGDAAREKADDNEKKGVDERGFGHRLGFGYPGYGGSFGSQQGFKQAFGASDKCRLVSCGRHCS